ncbi:RNA polymerase sigma-70 factor (ECF subfamily) [Pedobacter sp. AK017]|uniref:RNA polymerase sigma factor n=1 Tax=Pedobacter sp. AK017 TaxID=2723073 RepID=UPI00161B128B|nr:RNA polymerase sigma-70 factor [Pedobacter sp. AK017]MBB5441323.1 RNA polymerase sigma-70 factor (ECF subfamily) [Pedobacter sp. AK017]
MVAYSVYSDQELAALLKGGDATAFEEVYKRYYGLLYVHAHKRLRNEDDVKDVLQEFFASFWNNHKQLNLTGKLSAYLYSAIRYKIINLLLYKKTENKYLDSLQCYIDEDHLQADHLVRQKELARLIEDGIAALPPAMRHIFELSRIKHRSHKEIAEELGISELTVRTQVKRALRILRTKLGLFTYLLFLIKY